MKNYSIKTQVTKNLIDPNEYKFFMTPEDGIIINYISIEKYNESLSNISNTEYDPVYDEEYENFEYNNEEEYKTIKDIIVGKMNALGFHHDLVTQKYYDDILATEDDVEYCCHFVW